MSMRKFYRNTAACLLAALFLAAAGCSSTTSVFPSAEGSEEELAESGAGREDASGDAGQPGDSGDETEESTAGDAGQPGDSGDGTVTENTVIYVDVTGAVKAPGVYTLPAGSRVFEAIALAGGAREDASLENLNQAGILQDGQQIRVYTEEEAAQMAQQGSLPSLPGAEAAAGQKEGQEASKVNINTAGKDELMTLTGIGETRAEAILAYRQETGGFQAPEDLMQVEGIKEKTFEKLKDQITVN
ncbi:MAG TPA: helix-hairpin-helix domain-containing protein [Candidatus Pullilachnospira stercoravium]|uniref:Helix-hairpin-helix domain-containing protein n=1 Tax=Candidatus Pullilachnospira stercoravium TaxID=2840913 RepID=A0A9D1T523_9FIRM|nr:helix-hairpin-helix domain-containing protein [Candidatus Pullilachnospira stercoravium]